MEKSPTSTNMGLGPVEGRIVADDGLSKNLLSQIWVERRADEALSLF